MQSIASRLTENKPFIVAEFANQKGFAGLWQQVAGPRPLAANGGMELLNPGNQLLYSKRKGSDDRTRLMQVAPNY